MKECDSCGEIASSVHTYKNVNKDMEDYGRQINWCKGCYDDLDTDYKKVA